MRRRMIRTATVAVVAGGLLTACGGTDGQGAGSAAEGGDTLTVVGPFEVHSLDPATGEGFFTRLQVTETLADGDPDGTLRPGLATDWEATGGQRTWEFELREGARFHDGSPVTPEAVVTSLEAARGQEGTPLATVPVTGIEATESAVRVTLRKPFAPLPAVLAHTSTQVLAPASYDDDGKVSQVVGSGPYEVAELEQPSRIDLVAADSWDGDAPGISRVSYQAVGRPETRALMAESGQADVTLGMDPVSLQRVRSAEGVEVHSVTLPRSILLKVNAGHEILGDPQVRQALSLALDREAIATALLRDPEMAAGQLFPPSLPDWHQDDLPPLEHDLGRTKELLADAGWRPGADGVLERDGERFEVTLRTFPDRPELPVIATAVQARLEEIGIVLDVRVGNSSEIPAGHHDGSLELALFARNFALVPDPLVTLLQDFAPGGADWGAMGWEAPDLTRRLDRNVTGDATDPAADRRAVAEILQRELPVIPVAWYRQSAVVNDRVAGFELDPLERSWLVSDLTWTP